MLGSGPCTIALDGERELELHDGARRIEVRLDPGGPRVVDLEAALAAGARAGSLFVSRMATSVERRSEVRPRGAPSQRRAPRAAPTCHPATCQRSGARSATRRGRFHRAGRRGLTSHVERVGERGPGQGPPGAPPDVRPLQPALNAVSARRGEQQSYRSKKRDLSPEVLAPAPPSGGGERHPRSRAASRPWFEQLPDRSRRPRISPP